MAAGSVVPGVPESGDLTIGRPPGHGEAELGLPENPGALANLGLEVEHGTIANLLKGAWPGTGTGA